MAREEIIEKLDSFLRKHKTLNEEFYVVYLMVELRKLLDRNRENNIQKDYSLVRFYADWAIHTRKDFITPVMKKIMVDVENSIGIYPKKGNIDFLSMPEFRVELLDLLTENNLPSNFCIKNDKWLEFILTLTQILAHQPLVNPTDNISEFYYVNIKREGVMATINFKGSRNGQSITLGFGV